MRGISHASLHHRDNAANAGIASPPARIRTRNPRSAIIPCIFVGYFLNVTDAIILTISTTN